jgi:hypothetical protein
MMADNIGHRGQGTSSHDIVNASFVVGIVWKSTGVSVQLSLSVIRAEFFFHNGATAVSGPGPPHYRGFTITLRHTHSVGLL